MPQSLQSVDLVEFVSRFEHWFNVSMHEPVILTKGGRYAFVLLPISHYERAIALRQTRPKTPKGRERLDLSAHRPLP